MDFAGARRAVLGSLIVVLLAGCHGSVESEAAQVRALADFRPGTLADIGTGNGDFLPHYSRWVGQAGLVYGTEIDPALLDELRVRVAAEDLRNVLIVAASGTSTGLPDDCCELVILRHVYHHLTDPAAILDGIHRALKPQGQLLVVDFTPTLLLAPWTPDDLPEDRSGHGVTPDQIVAEARLAGFEAVKVEPELPGGHPLMESFAVLLERQGTFQ